MPAELFDWQERFEQLDNGGDPLLKLNAVIQGETFRTQLEKVRQQDRKSTAGKIAINRHVRYALQSLFEGSELHRCQLGCVRCV